MPDVQIRTVLQVQHEYDEQNDEGYEQAAGNQLERLEDESPGFALHERQVSDSGTSPWKNSLMRSHTPTPGSLL